ncbi:hypothetical protein HWI79_2480 [Cryptosporidium felis]|nr:hypothetical protein HWI79_2480 [Cryptosporidium felis]
MSTRVVPPGTEYSETGAFGPQAGKQSLAGGEPKQPMVQIEPDLVWGKVSYQRLSRLAVDLRTVKSILKRNSSGLNVAFSAESLESRVASHSQSSEVVLEPV